MTQMVVGEKKGTCGSGSLVYVVGSLAKACNWACSLAMHTSISENQIVNWTRQTRQAPVKNDWFTVAANQHWSCFKILLSEHLARIPRCHVPQRWRSLGDPVDRSLCHFISHLIKLLQKSVSKSGDVATALTNLNRVFDCTPCPLHWGCISWQRSFHLRIRSLSFFHRRWSCTLRWWSLPLPDLPEQPSSPPSTWISPFYWHPLSPENQFSKVYSSRLRVTAGAKFIPKSFSLHQNGHGQKTKHQHECRCIRLLNAVSSIC